MKRKIILTLLACITSVYLNGQATASKAKPVQRDIDNLLLQNEIFYPVTVFGNAESKVEEGIGPYTKLTVDKQKINDVFKANYKSIRLEIPLAGNKSVSVLLTQHKIHSDDFELSITDANGKHPAAMNEGHYYYGVIENGFNTLAAISVFDNEINGVISDQRGNWNLGERKNHADEYAFFNDLEFKLPIHNECGTEDDNGTQNKNGGGGGNTTLATYAQNYVHVFFDCGYPYYLYKGSNSTAVTNYTNSIFNVQNTICYNDYINLSISSIHIWATADPFDYTSTTTGLNTFSAWWIGNGGYNGNIANLLSTSATLGGGLAQNFGYVCGQNNSYSIAGIHGNASNSYPTYTWDAEVVTHECGHTLGSRHTHACVWNGNNTAIDNCGPTAGYAYEGSCSGAPTPSNGGTIMSYCHLVSGVGINFSNGFGPQPADAIRTVIFNASCINTSCSNAGFTTLNTSYLIPTGDKTTLTASGVITATGGVNSGAELTYYSGASITLLPNFDVQNGGTFLAKPITCGPVPPVPAAVLMGNSARGIAIKETTFGNYVLVSPNPFVDELKAAFELTEVAQVTVRIIDQTGREVELAISNKLMEKGRQEVSLNPAKLSPGMYFVAVSINDVVYTKKIVKL